MVRSNEVKWILICVHITATVQNSSNVNTVVVEASVHQPPSTTTPTTPVQSTPSTGSMSTTYARTVVAAAAQTPCVPPSSSSRLCQHSLGETGNFCCTIIYLYLYLSLLLYACETWIILASNTKQALQCHIDLALGHLPYQGWRPSQ